jgi:hypothetical protein
MDWLKCLNEAGVGAGFVLSVATLIAGYRYYSSNLRSQRKLSARQTYRSYMQLAFEHPRFAEPEDFEAIPIGSEQHHQYEWFVFILLSACGEIIASLGQDFGARWKVTLLTQLKCHAKYLLENEWFQTLGFNQLDDNVRGLIDELRGSVGGGGRAQP